MNKSFFFGTFRRSKLWYSNKNDLQDMEMKSGFTLIEVMLVVALILVIGIVSAAFYGRFLMQNAVSDATDTLAGALRKTQLYSMEGRRDSAWGVKVSVGQIVVFKGDSYDSRDTAFDEVSNVNSNVELSGMSEVVFSRVTGLPSDTPTVTVSGQGNTKTLTINSQGIVGR